MATKETKKNKKEEVVSEDSGQEEEPAALYDQPLIIEGKRKRRSVELFAFTPSNREQVKSTADYQGGDGVKFGDIAIIQHNITKTKADDLKYIYKLCFDSTVSLSSTAIKKNLRSFSGWRFTEDSDDFKKRVSQLERLVIPEIKILLDFLSLKTDGNKADLIARLMAYLAKPIDNGVPVPEPKRKRKSSIEKGGGPTKKSKIDNGEKEGEEDDKEIGEADKEKAGEKEEEEKEKETKMETEEQQPPPAAAADKQEEETDEKKKTSEKEESKQDAQPMDAQQEVKQNNVSDDKPVESSSHSPAPKNNEKLSSDGKKEDKPLTAGTEE